MQKKLCTFLVMAMIFTALSPWVLAADDETEETTEPTITMGGSISYIDENGEEIEEEAEPVSMPLLPEAKIASGVAEICSTNGPNTHTLSFEDNAITCTMKASFTYYVGESVSCTDVSGTTTCSGGWSKAAGTTSDPSEETYVDGLGTTWIRANYKVHVTKGMTSKYCKLWIQCTRTGSVTKGGSSS